MGEVAGDWGLPIEIFSNSSPPITKPHPRIIKLINTMRSFLVFGGALVKTGRDYMWLEHVTNGLVILGCMNVNDSDTEIPPDKIVGKCAICPFTIIY